MSLLRVVSLLTCVLLAVLANSIQDPAPIDGSFARPLFYRAINLTELRDDTLFTRASSYQGVLECADTYCEL